MKLGDLIKAYRHENKVTIQEFASRASLSKGYVSMLERNQHPQSQRPLTPSLETYQKVAGAMGITLDELISVLDGDEKVKLSYNVPFELCTTEQSLISSFRQLNEEGQGKALEYVGDLVATGRYNSNADQPASLQSGTDQEDYLMVNAAHQREDVDITDEMRKHDDDIMDDEFF